jgi:hypothetical protein
VGTVLTHGTALGGIPHPSNSVKSHMKEDRRIDFARIKAHWKGFARLLIYLFTNNFFLLRCALDALVCGVVKTGHYAYGGVDVD